MGASRKSLRTELLFNLAFLTSAAVILVGLTTLLLSVEDLRSTVWALGTLWLGSTVVFVLFGMYLTRRLVLKPLESLATVVDELAEGRLSEAVPEFETEEFARLGERFRRMTEQLTDTQTQLVRVEKLAGIGRLAAGVAHEIRNPLGAIGNYVEVLRKRGETPEVAEAMTLEIGRIDAIVESLLSYASPRPQIGETDLNAVVASTLEFLGHQGALKGPAVECQLARELPSVLGDRQALEQVVVNLLLNARDSAPRGRIEIGTVSKPFLPRSEERRRDDRRNPDVEQRHPASRPWRSDIPAEVPGALLYVADDGPGVRDEDRDRIFDPFFTTKEPGKGTGLGLAIVARTVHESGGVVWVDRAREGGAVFKMFLPRAGAVDASLHR